MNGDEAVAAKGKGNEHDRSLYSRRRPHAARPRQGRQGRAQRHPPAGAARADAEPPRAACRHRHPRRGRRRDRLRHPGRRAGRRTSRATPCSPPIGPSKSPASRSTASAARACRPSTSPRWASSSGTQELVVGGGVESMSRVPMGSDGARHRRQQPASSARSIFQVPQGISADLIATLEGFTRERRRRLRPRLAAQGRRRPASEPLRAQPLPRHRPRDRRAGPRRGRVSRAPAPPPKALAALEPAFARARRHAVRPQRRDDRSDRPRRATRRPARSTTSTPPATPAASSTAPPPCCSPPTTTSRRTGSSRARASARWRPPAPSRSSC